MENDLILTQESSPAKIRDYFQYCLYLMRQGVNMPVGLNEVWQLVFDTYEEAEEELKSEYIEGIDFSYSAYNKYYALTVTCAEGLVFRKKPHLRFIYRDVFYPTIYEQTKVIRKSYKSLSKEYKALLVKYEKALAKVETARSRRDEAKKAADKTKKAEEKNRTKLQDEIKKLKTEVRLLKKQNKEQRKMHEKNLRRQSKELRKQHEKELSKQNKELCRQHSKDMGKQIKKAVYAVVKGGML